MRRREFVHGAAAALVVASLPSHGEQPLRVFRVGYPVIAPLPGLKPWVGAFEQGLREQGFTPASDVLIEVRSAGGKIERYGEIVQEVVRLKPDVILTGVNSNTAAVKAATREIPIVMVLGTNVVRSGFATSFARPGGNVTGMTADVGGGTMAKSLQLLHELAPGISRVAILWEAPSRLDYETALEGAASSLGLNVSWYEYSGDPQRDFDAIARWRADAVFHLAGARMYGHRNTLTALDAKHRLPATYPVSEWADAGGLMSYGPNIPDLFRSAARHVTRILRGAKPGDLPIEQPTKFDFVLNLKAAKALGLTIPQSILLQANRLIE